MQAAVYEKPLTSPPPGALEMLFREHHGAVYRAAYRITGNAMDAEDVLQTVFARLLRREEQPDLSESAGSYLHRAAVNAALDLMRRRKRSRKVDLDEVGESLVDSADPGPERLRGSRELKTRLREAMSRLSPRQAEIFTLRYLEGLGNLEIARLLGASQTSIAVLLHRARHRLQKELGSLEGDLS
ncbi:MAG: sigma-70 family RNA polymerase sigma factor [Thermoanaerobaculia bacterium]